MARDERVVIRCNEETKVRWKNLCNEIDTNADYEEVVEMLCDFFEADQSRVDAVRRAAKGPEFR